MRTKGWKHESARHSLARKGIKTKGLALRPTQKDLYLWKKYVPDARATFQEAEAQLRELNGMDSGISQYFPDEYETQRLAEMIADRTNGADWDSYEFDSLHPKESGEIWGYARGMIAMWYLARGRPFKKLEPKKGDYE
jgi:hypothetical protein